MFAKLNKAPKKWDKSTEGFDYIKLRDYIETHGYDSELKVFGYYINDVPSGKALTIIADDCFINMPSHALLVFSQFGEEQDNAINEGHLALGNFRDTLVKRYNQKTIYFDYLDI